jgi:hypothetical protein
MRPLKTITPGAPSFPRSLRKGWEAKTRLAPIQLTLALLALALLAGCRAHMVSIRLTNSSAGPLSTIIVDYPSATFGKDQLAPNETFASSVRFTDDGPIKVRFTDAQGHNHLYTGPVVHKNDEGSIDLKLNQSDALATPDLTSH